MKKLNEIFDMCPSFYERESFANGYLKGYEQAEKDLAPTIEEAQQFAKIAELYSRKLWVPTNKE